MNNIMLSYLICWMSIQRFVAHNKVEAILDDAWKFSKNITDLLAEIYNLKILL